MAAEIENYDGLDARIDAKIMDLAHGEGFLRSYRPGVLRQVWWTLSRMVGFDVSNSKRRYIDDCLDYERKLRMVMTRERVEEKRVETRELVDELSEKVSTLKGQYEKILDLCSSSRDEIANLELRLDRPYRLDMRRLGFDDFVDLNGDEIVEYIDGFRRTRVLLKNHTSVNPVMLNGSVLDDKTVEAYLKVTTDFLERLEREQMERQESSLTLTK